MINTQQISTVSRSDSRDRPALLVVTCDKYADLWDGFFNRLNEEFPEWSSFDIFVLTNTSPKAMSGVDGTHNTLGLSKQWMTHVHWLAVGDVDWSTGYKQALAQVPHKYVLPMLEDFFLESPVTMTKFAHALDQCVSNDLDCLKLTRDFAHNHASSPAEIKDAWRLIDVDQPYRVCTQAALWKKSSLQSLIIAGESPWAFESLGTGRARVAELRIARVTSPVFHYQHVVERGTYRRKYLSLVRSAGIDPNTAARPTMRLSQHLFAEVKAAVHSVVMRMPASVREPFLRVGARGAAAAGRLM